MSEGPAAPGAHVEREACPRVAEHPSKTSESKTAEDVSADSQHGGMHLDTQPDDSARLPPGVTMDDGSESEAASEPKAHHCKPALRIKRQGTSESLSIKNVTLQGRQAVPPASAFAAQTGHETAEDPLAAPSRPRPRKRASINILQSHYLTAIEDHGACSPKKACISREVSTELTGPLLQPLIRANSRILSQLMQPPASSPNPAAAEGQKAVQQTDGSALKPSHHGGGGSVVVATSTQIEVACADEESPAEASSPLSDAKGISKEVLDLTSKLFLQQSEGNWG